ncbi:MAG: DUF3604 domain-containing protein [Thermoanaerobaculia bacterium]
MRENLLLSAVVVMLLATAPSVAQSIGAPGRDSGKPNPLKNVYFGEQHLHTQASFDAYTAGTLGTWEEAYRFGRGEEVEFKFSNKANFKIKRRTPYDFVAITDHAQYYGVFMLMADPSNPLSKTEFGKQMGMMVSDPTAAGPAVSKLIAELAAGIIRPDLVTPELRTGRWQDFIKTADKFNEPGKFTALYAFEWTSQHNSQNMHRNVFFKDKPPAAPYSALDSFMPEDLWTYLESQRNQGIDTFAIPHNGNVSDGQMYSLNEYLGGPMSAAYARRQNLNEPLTEILQTKGNSETHPWLSPNDEFAKFEQFPNLISTNTPSAIKHGYVRQALVDGMTLETKLGHNPYKMGIVAGADIHSAYQGNEEWAWQGAHGILDNTPQARLSPVPNATGALGSTVSGAGTTAVWATENTRAGIFNGMKSKETYGTTGTLIRLRFFGGWDLPAKLTSDEEFVKKAYAAGVPMGQDLPKMPANAKSPTFAVWALKDPESGNLDRIQIVKGWANPATGFPEEKIYEVAWSDNRKLDPKTGKLPPVGNTVDIKNASYTNNIGDTQLSVVWTDPDFDTKLKAVYYVRVLEIPTPRWSTYDAVALGVAPPEGVPASIQERAYSSPIWYSPGQ